MYSVKEERYVIKLRSSTDEPCSVVLFLKFVNELLANTLQWEGIQRKTTEWAILAKRFG